MNSLIKNLDLYFSQRAPRLPMSVKKFLVAVIPWLAILSVLIAFPSLLSVLGARTFMTPYGNVGPAFYGPLYFSLVVSVIGAAFNLVAISGLFRRSAKAWRLVFYSTLLYTASSLIAADLIGAILTFVIGMYVLFQIKSYYI